MFFVDEKVKYALKQRQENAIKKNDEELWMAIQYETSVGVIKRSDAHEYSTNFLDALAENGVEVVTPKKSTGGKWLFRLPAIEGYDYDD